jgi:four helix bundle protein
MEKSIQSYKELRVWQKSIELVKDVYRLTGAFPQSELYGLTNQMRRAVISIPSNIAEGYSRSHRMEYLQFLRIALSSGAELETQLIIARELGLTKTENFGTSEVLLAEVMRMLQVLLKSLRSIP